MYIFDKAGVLKNCVKQTEIHMFLSLIFIKVEVWGLQLYQKRDASEISNIFENTPYKEHFWVAACIIIDRKLNSQC